MINYKDLVMFNDVPIPVPFPVLSQSLSGKYPLVNLLHGK